MKDSLFFFDKLLLRVPLNPLHENGGTLNNIEREAIYLSSSKFYKEYEEVEKNGAGRLEVLQEVANKYLKRSKFKCVPFGLFAGCQTIEWDNYTNIILGDTNTFKRHTRLDMHFVGLLADYLKDLPVVKNNVKYYPNSTIRKTNGKLRYIEPITKGGAIEYQMTEVFESDALNEILEFAKGGKRIDEIAQIVSADVTVNELLEFINELIDSGVLISEFHPNVTIIEYFWIVLENLERINEGLEGRDLDNIISVLKETNIDLREIDRQLGNSPIKYEKIKERLRAIIPHLDEGKLFQTDLIVNVSSGKLNRNLQSSLKEVVFFFSKINSLNELPTLQDFKERFIDRYGDSEVSLMLALDTESGIGYGNRLLDSNPIIDNLKLPSEIEKSVYWDPFISFLLGEISRSLAENRVDVDISEYLDSSLKPELSDDILQHNLNDTFAILFSHVGIIQGNETLHIHSIGGASGGNLLGRFAYADDDICDLVIQATEFESKKNAGAIIAEIVHLPSEFRLGNVLFRPKLRDYEIPILTKSLLNEERQISLDDLYISIKNGSLFLRSKKFNKQVIPKLTTAHNYKSSSLPVYQFLCDIQSNDRNSNLGFNFETIKKILVYIPRIVFKNIIISPATWNLSYKDFSSLLEISTSVVQSQKKIEQFQRKWNIPDFISIVDGNSSLVVDLKNKDDIFFFLKYLKKRNSLILEEYLMINASTVVNEKNQKFANEFIAIVGNKRSVQSSNEIVYFDDTEISGKFIPGSEWLYYKLYCGIRASDVILKDYVLTLIDVLEERSLIKRWFFIRFQDPEYHLRLRFQVDRNNLDKVEEVLNKKLDQLLKKDLIWKVQIDTYIRELDRYGKDTISIAEEFFYYDSSSVLEMLQHTEEDMAYDRVRWLFVLKSIDNLLLCFKYKLEDKLRIMEHLKVAFSREFQMNRKLKSQIDKKYREEYRFLAEFLIHGEIPELFLPFIQIIEKNSGNFRNIFNRMVLFPNVDIDNIVSSFIHMMINRVFRSKHRLNELIIYDFLYRTYKSSIAKLEYSKNEV